MGKEIKKSVTDPDEKDSQEAALEGHNTEKLPHTPLEGAPPGGAEPEGARSQEDDVYVILPEGDTSEIPVVETQVLEDPTEVDASAAETGDLAATETTAIENDDTSAIGGSPTEAIEARETQDLDQMARDLEDQVLAESAGITSEIVPAVSDTAGQAAFLAGAAEDAGEKTELESTQTIQAPTRSGWVKGVLAAAALLAVAAAGLWYLGDTSGLGVGQVAGVATGGGTSTSGGTGTGPVDPTATGVAGTQGSDAAKAASLEAFRGKLVAALELGFGVEVKNE